MNIISLSNNLDSIHRTSNNIPENFNWKLYASIVKNNSLYNVSLAYNHYIQNGQFNPNIYKLFWRTIYDIPHNFNEESYKKYLEEKCKVYLTFKTNEDLYKFYHYTGHKLYPLNDQYSRIHFNIPDDFNDNIYTTLYPEAQLENINMIYNFYNTNKHKFPLNDTYYKLLYNIPYDFNLNEYKYINKLNYNNTDIYQHYNSYGKNLKQIHKNTFNNNNTINKNTINKNIINKNTIDNNINKLDLLIPALAFNNFDFNFEKINNYFNDSSNDFNNDSSNDFNNDSSNDSSNDSNNNFNNDSNNNSNNNSDSNMLECQHNISEEEIKEYDKNKNNFDFIIFNKRYNFTLNETESKQLYNEKFYEYPLDEIYYRLFYNIPNEFKKEHIKTFILLYNLDNNKTEADIYKYYNNMVKNVYNDENITNEKYIDFFYIEEFIDKTIIFYDNIFLFNFFNNKIKLSNIYDIYLNNPSSQQGTKFIEHYNYLIYHKKYIYSEFLKKQYFLLKSFVNEYFKENEMKFIIEENIMIPLYTTFYYNYNFQDQKLFLNINKWENIYKIYTNQYYYTNLFKKIKSPNKINDNINLVFFLFDNYTHNYISLMKTLTAIKENYKIIIYTTKSINSSYIFNEYYNLLSINFNISISCVNDNFTFADFNNMFNDINLWRQFKADYIVLFNSLAILKEDIFLKIIKDDFVGATYNKSTFSNFTIINKNKIVTILENNNNNNNQYLYELNKTKNVKLFKKRFNLEKKIEDFLYPEYLNKFSTLSFIYFLDDENNLINILNNI